MDDAFHVPRHVQFGSPSLAIFGCEAPDVLRSSSRSCQFINSFHGQRCNICSHARPALILPVDASASSKRTQSAHCAKVSSPGIRRAFFQPLGNLSPSRPRPKSAAARRKQPSAKASKPKASKPKASKPKASKFPLHTRVAADVYSSKNSGIGPKVVAQPEMHRLPSERTGAKKGSRRAEIERTYAHAAVQKMAELSVHSGRQSTGAASSNRAAAHGYQSSQTSGPMNTDWHSNRGHDGLAYSGLSPQSTFNPYNMGMSQSNNAFSGSQPFFFTPNIGTPMNAPLPLGFFTPSLSGSLQGQLFPVQPTNEYTRNGQFSMNTFASSAHQTVEPYTFFPPQPTYMTSHQPLDRHRAPITAPSAASGGIPNPTDAYLLRASFMPKRREQPGPLLVVIDLNGTLLHRPRRTNSRQFNSRRHAERFVEYCVETFWVVIWSSAKPDNVQSMVAQLLPGPIGQQLVAVWGRDKFGLTPADSCKRTQCYKRLTRLWDDPKIKSTYPRNRPGFENGCWDQGNTVLIDDSLEKARSEPHNAITLPEYKGGEDAAWDVLPSVHDYLNELCYQADVSAYIRAHPFKMAEGLEGPRNAASGGAVAIESLPRVDDTHPAHLAP